MATLVAIGYPDQGTAEQARDTVARLESELIIQADQVASISRDPEGKYHVHTSHGGGGGTAGGAVWGGFWGLLFGLLFFIPFAGWAMGAGLGALFGHMSQKGIDKAFQEQVREYLQPGHFRAVHGDRAGHSRQGGRGARAVRGHGHQDLALRRGHAEAAGSPDSAGRGSRRRLLIPSTPTQLPTFGRQLGEGSVLRLADGSRAEECQPEIRDTLQQALKLGLVAHRTEQNRVAGDAVEGHVCERRRDLIAQFPFDSELIVANWHDQESSPPEPVLNRERGRFT